MNAVYFDKFKRKSENQTRMTWLGTAVDSDVDRTLVIKVWYNISNDLHHLFRKKKVQKEQSYANGML